MTEIEIFNTEGGMENIDKILSIFKDKGLSQYDCTKFLVKEVGLKLVDADYIVLHSPTWKVNKEKVINFREGLADYLSNFTDSKESD